ncbi:MAG: holo-ACP synthase [Alphaproteobacteria bacterium]|nr:holo-ACP synthase [Alphaproteobacteria bacterium]
MIVGLGTDIVSVDRIAMVLERNQSQFIDRICTKDEKKYLQQCKDIKTKLAKIWAVKEAAVKALGTGFVQGISFTDIELQHDSLGKPEIVFYGKAKEILEAKIEGKTANILVSLSDDKPFAQAVVIIEKSCC